MGIVELRLVMELRGLSCLELEQCPPPKKGITCARSFGKAVTRLSEMEEAVSKYVTRAAEKLRSEQLLVTTLTVFMHTNQFKDAFLTRKACLAVTKKGKSYLIQVLTVL